MNPAIASMLGRYNCVTVQDYENALKEIMQEIALLGLWRSKFFEHAAFYGGTALRILYGLDRFSEDLDFSLLKPNKQFQLAPYLTAVRAELNGMGFNVTVEEKHKTIESSVESAFIKAGTQEHLIKITVPEAITDRTHRNKLLNIKFEVDTDPPPDFNTEAKILLQPIPFSINTYKPADLFAGKIHAILQRNWKGRVKGRDYYDFVWYRANKIPVHLFHLEQRMRQSSGWTAERPMEKADLFDLLEEKFAVLDVVAAKKDVAPFLKDKAAIDLWSHQFFSSLLNGMELV